jgi:hypothetical protein
MEAANRIASSGSNPVLPGTGVVMDREFIIKNQIVERYITGRLPPKGVTDFERVIRANPGLIEELGIPERVNAALRLLDTAGAAEPWAEKKKKVWETTPFVATACAVALGALIGVAVLASSVASRDARITALQAENHERAVSPSTHKRTIIVQTTRGGPPSSARFTISAGELAEMKLDLSWAPYSMYRASLDRVDQGRVAIFDGLTKDSNGHVRVSINANAFGPGDHMIFLEGLNMRREALPIAWVRFTVSR